MILPDGIEEDSSIRAALEWFASISGDPSGFWRRLWEAQQAYARVTAGQKYMGQDFELSAFGQDVVASFLAQAKSLLDSRRCFDFGLASRYIPWIKQIGVNLEALSQVSGAADRARRMLADQSVEPDGALFELAMAGNYAAEGEGVAFVDERPGVARTPDLHLFIEGQPERVAVEFKRLRRGEYELQERRLQQRIFRQAEDILNAHSLSLHIDINYKAELQDVPESYLADWLRRYLSSPLIMVDRYPWQDQFGFGEIRTANVDAVLQDIKHTSLYVGTKFARLLAKGVVRESTYQLAAGLDRDDRDPRFFKEIHYGSVVTWQCTSPKAIERKARHVKSKLIEAGRQVKAEQVGVVHLAMDVEIGCESSDLRRERNKAVITEFRSESPLAALYVHYLVPRISEQHAWLIDETVDKFGRGVDEVPSMMIFSHSKSLGNDLPAWWQRLAVPRK